MCACVFTTYYLFVVSLKELINIPAFLPNKVFVLSYGMAMCLHISKRVDGYKSYEETLWLTAMHCYLHTQKGNTLTLSSFYPL